MAGEKPDKELSLDEIQAALAGAGPEAEAGSEAARPE
jgi:hypothetical protein